MTNEKILLQLEKGYDIKNPQLAQALSNLEDKIGITKAELEEAIEAKANLVGGKVPAEELPSYVDDVIEFNNIQVADAEISSIIGNNLYKNQIRFVNNSTTLPDRIGSEDKYPDMFVNFGENTSEDDWTTFEPEKGKIYINATNNHSYRWSGSLLIDLDQAWSQGIKDLQENTVRTDEQTLSADKQKQVFENLGWKVYVSTSDVIVNNPSIPDDVINEIKDCQAILLSDTGYLMLKGRQDAYYCIFSAVVDSGNIKVLQIDTANKNSTDFVSSNINDVNALHINGSQTLNIPTKNTTLATLGTNFVIIPRNYLGTTLVEPYKSKVKNATALIITEGDARGACVFLKTSGDTTNSAAVLDFTSSITNNTVRRITYTTTNYRLSEAFTIKVPTDAVRTTTQDLTDVQKQQARTNIGVQSADELLEDADFIAQLKTKLGIE